MSRLIYVITAHKFGEYDTHTYVVGASLNAANARSRAKVERDERGGKYAVRVLELEDHSMLGVSEGQVVAFYPLSRYPDERKLVVGERGA